jgi:hypothetical protein
MQRCAELRLATVTSLREALKNIPNDCLISTNRVGNLSILRAFEEHNAFVLVGYIELTNTDYALANIGHIENGICEANKTMFVDTTTANL